MSPCSSLAECFENTEAHCLLEPNSSGTRKPIPSRFLDRVAFAALERPSFGRKLAEMPRLP